MINELALNEEFLNDKKKSFKEFLDNTVHLETKYNDVIHEFYSKSFTAPNKLTYLDTFPEYGESSGNYRYRFIIIKIDEDFVFTNLKVIDPRNGSDRYFHIYHPISLGGSIENEYIVMVKLSGFQFIRDIVTLNDSGDFTEWCNNYYNTKESCEYMFKSKWKSKHCINKMNSIISTEFIDYDNGKLSDEIMEFSERWESIRKDKSEKKSDKKLISMMNKSDNMLITNIFNPKLVTDFYLFVSDEICYYSFSNFLNSSEIDKFLLQLYIEIMKFKFKYTLEAEYNNVVYEAKKIYNKYFNNNSQTYNFLNKEILNNVRKSCEMIDKGQCNYEMFDNLLVNVYSILKEKFYNFQKTDEYKILVQNINMNSYIQYKVLDLPNINAKPLNFI